jgi:hypothetical protein
MTRKQFFKVSTIVVTLVFSLTGCNRENLPGLGKVTGTVTMDGKPVPEAMVSFEPVDGSAAPAMGRTDGTGLYELYYSRTAKGAKIGEHAVRITSYQEFGEDDARQIKKETIPSRYNVKTELKATVNRGQNKIDFDLKSGGEIIQPNEDEKTGKKKRSVTGCS